MIAQDGESLALYYNVLIVIFFFLELIFKPKGQRSHFFAWGVIIIISLFIGFRSIDSTADTRNYWISYSNISYLGNSPNIFSTFKLLEEPILYLIFYLSSLIGDFNFALWLVSLLTLSLIYNVCINICKITDINTPLLLFLTYLVSFYIQSQQFHVMRSGLAMGFILNFYNYILINNRKKTILFGILAVLTHITSLIPITCAIIAKFINLKRSKYILIFFIVILLSYLGWGFNKLTFLANLGIDKVENYLSTEYSEQYVLGFRLSFVLFNTMFLWLFLINKVNTNFYQLYLHLFILLSIVLFLSFQIPYFDRIGAFSWNIIPILLYYCIIKKHPKQYYIYGNSIFIFMFIVKFGISLISG